MGMFDSVQWNMRLPIKNDSKARVIGNPFQSKSVRSWEMEHLHALADEHGILTITVDPQGQMTDHLGLALRWSGTLHFYGPVPHHSPWLEFDAQIQDGRVVKVHVRA